MSRSKPNDLPRRHEFELQEFELQEFLSISNYFFVLFFFLFDRALVLCEGPEDVFMKGKVYL